MNYEDLYMKYEKYIHYLLKKYYIQYNKDDYYYIINKTPILLELPPIF